MLLGIALPIFGVVLVPGGLPVAGWGWDALNGLGLAGIVLLAVIGWTSESPARPPRLRLHQALAVVVTALVTLHAAGFLLADPLTLEYLKPTAPVYMLIGVLAYLLLLALTITSFPGPRRSLYRRFQHFRRWHLGLSLGVLGTALWHVLGTDFLYRDSFRAAVLLLVAAALPSFAVLRRRRGVRLRIGRDRTATVRWLVAAIVILSGAVTLLLGFPALQTRLRADAPMLPVTFAHATHTTVNCITCHHNFVDSSGQGLCLDCHQHHPDVRALRETQFHTLCRDCHLEKHTLGEDGGPVRACVDCHTADEAP